jgi:hypothetical protein
MCVSDRVMGGDVRARYKPDNSLVAKDNVEMPRDLQKQQTRDGRVSTHLEARLGLRDMVDDIRINTILMHWDQLKNKEEHYRLAEALMDHFDFSFQSHLASRLLPLCQAMEKSPIHCKQAQSIQFWAIMRGPLSVF